jgi:hypothetical protein
VRKLAWWRQKQFANQVHAAALQICFLIPYLSLIYHLASLYDLSQSYSIMKRKTFA